MPTRIPQTDLGRFQELNEKLQSARQAIANLQNKDTLESKLYALKQQVKTQAVPNPSTNNELETLPLSLSLTVEWLKGLWLEDNNTSPSSPSKSSSTINQGQLKEEIEGIKQELKSVGQWEEKLHVLEETEEKLFDKVFKRSDGPGDPRERLLGQEVARTTRELRDALRARQTYTTCLSYLDQVIITSDEILSIIANLQDTKGKIISCPCETLQESKGLIQQHLLVLLQCTSSVTGICLCGIDDILERPLRTLKAICEESKEMTLEKEEISEIYLEIKQIGEEIADKTLLKRDSIMDYIDSQLQPAIKGLELLLSESKIELRDHRRNLLSIAIQNDGWCINVESMFRAGYIRSDLSPSKRGLLAPVFNDTPIPRSHSLNVIYPDMSGDRRSSGSLRSPQSCQYTSLKASQTHSLGRRCTDLDYIPSPKPLSSTLTRSLSSNNV